MTTVFSNADTIMDLANGGYPPSSPSRVIYQINEENTDDRNSIVYTMQEPDHQAEVDRIVSDHIVSAVKKGLRKSKKSSSSKVMVPKLSPKALISAPTVSNNEPMSPQNQQDPQQNNRRGDLNHHGNRSRSTKKGGRQSPQRQSRLASKLSKSYKPKISSRSSRGVEVVPVVSDDETNDASSRHQRSRYSTDRSEWTSGTEHSASKSSNDTASETAGFPGFLHRMIYNEEQTVDDSMQTSHDSVDCEYNYIDDESYGNTTDEDSRSRSSSFESDYDETSGTFLVKRRGRGRGRQDRRHDTNDEDGTTTASLSEDAFEMGMRDSHDGSREAESSTNQGEDDGTNKNDNNDNKDKDSEAFRYVSPASAPRGLDIVARLLAGATELSLDASSITASNAEEDRGGGGGGSKSGNSTPVHEIARHVSDALAQTTDLQRISFCGPWNGNSFRERLVLEILFDGLLDNTSIHTVVIRDNPIFDRYTGYAFGTMLKMHPRLSKLEIVHCRFVQSGWYSLFVGMQHSNNIKTLWVEDCPNLSGDHIDAISTTIRYLQMKCLRLCGVKLESIDVESLSFLLRSIQQTKTLKEVDLSKNDLGGAPRAVLLLSKCLSGDPVWIGNGDHNERNHLPINYHHHIEKLMLVDCGISEKSSIRTLVRALDSTQAKLDASNNEHPLVLHTLDVSKNKFGNGGARILQKLVDTNPKITTLGMVGCNASASSLKTMADRLRYNNSFLQRIGLSSDVSLAILDSVSAVEHVFGGGSGSKSKKNSTVGGAAGAAIALVEDDESDIEPSGGCCA